MTNQSDGSEVFIPWQGIKHALSGKRTHHGVIATAKLDKVLEEARFIRSEPDSRGRASIRAIHVYETPISLGGTRAVIRSIVRETNAGRRYYDHFEVAGKSPLGGTSGDGPGSQTTQPTPNGETATDAADTQTVSPPDESSQSDDSTSPDVRHSRSEQTRSDYEQRIDELFAGADAARLGVRVLDSSDILEVLGYGQRPVHVAEGKIKAGRQNHHLKAEHWKKIPEWLDNPVAVFESDTVPGRLVAVAPDTVNGAPVMMILEPDAKVEAVTVHLLANAYDKDSGRVPFRRWAEDGLWLYGDEKRIPAFNRSSGLRLPRVSDFRQGYGKKIHTQNDLVKHRNASRRKVVKSATPEAVRTPILLPAQAIRTIWPMCCDKPAMPPWKRTRALSARREDRDQPE